MELDQFEGYLGLEFEFLSKISSDNIRFQFLIIDLVNFNFNFGFLQKNCLEISIYFAQQFLCKS